MMSLFKKKESPALRRKVETRRLSPLQWQIVVGIIIVIVISLLITAVYYITRINSLQIKNIEVIGGQTIPHNVISDSVESSLQGSYFRLVPKKFRPFYPRSAIIENIKSNHRVKNVHVEIGDSQTVTVVFDEYTPHALWCEHSDSEECLFIDSVGFAFAQAPSLEGSAFIRYVEDGKVPELKSNSFESAYIKETSLFAEELKDKLSLYVTHITKQGTYDIEYTIAGGGVIKISQAIPMHETFANLETILQSEEFVHIEPGAFQYIDLRFGDKVFVNEEKVSDTTATTSSSTAQIVE